MLKYLYFRLLVERLLNTCLVPYHLPPEERMKKLYHLYGTIDENAGKAFTELQKHQMATRKSIAEFVELHKNGDSGDDKEKEKEIALRIGQISKSLPDPLKVQEYLREFSNNLWRDSKLLSQMETVVSPEVSCKESVDTVSLVLKKLGQPVMTNLYYNIIKTLLERVSNVMIDSAALQVLVDLVEGALTGDESVLEAIQLPADIAVERGLRLLFVLSYMYPAHFLQESIIQRLLDLLDKKHSNSCPSILSVLSFIGKYKPVGDAFPHLADKLLPLSQEFITNGSPKQAKQAVKCLHINLPNQAPTVFNSILDQLRDQLTFDSTNFKTAVVAMGHIAFHMPDKFTITIKNTVARKIVKELLMRNQTADHIPGPLQGEFEEWIEEEELSLETQVKAEGIKMMARWLLGLKNDEISAQKTFRMLNAFILKDGDLLQTNKML